MNYSSTIANYNRNIRELLSRYKDLIKQLEFSIRRLEQSLRTNKKGQKVIAAPNLQTWKELSTEEKQSTFEAAHFVKNQVDLLNKGRSKKLASTKERYFAHVGKTLNKRMHQQIINQIKSPEGSRKFAIFENKVAQHDTKNWELRHNKLEHVKLIKDRLRREGYSKNKYEAELIVAMEYDEIYQEVKQLMDEGIINRKEAWWEVYNRRNARIKKLASLEGGAVITDIRLKHLKDLKGHNDEGLD